MTKQEKVKEIFKIINSYHKAELEELQYMSNGGEIPEGDDLIYWNKMKNEIKKIIIK
jgi:hypothetical protein